MAASVDYSGLQAGGTVKLLCDGHKPKHEFHHNHTATLQRLLTWAGKLTAPGKFRRLEWKCRSKNFVLRSGNTGDLSGAETVVVNLRSRFVPRHSTGVHRRRRSPTCLRRSGITRRTFLNSGFVPAPMNCQKKTIHGPRLSKNDTWSGNVGHQAIVLRSGNVGGLSGV